MDKLRSELVELTDKELDLVGGGGGEPRPIREPAGNGNGWAYGPGNASGNGPPPTNDSGNAFGINGK